MDSWTRLQAFERENGQIPIAIVGAGYVASGVVHVLEHTPGVRPAIIVNRTPAHAIKAFTDLGVNEDDIVISDDPGILAKAIARQRPAITHHYDVLSNLAIGAVVEATGALDYGTRAILASIEYGHHVVSYNAEVDALLGWLFHKKARENGVVYTIADGDQPGALFRIAQQVENMGFEVTTMLNCKRYLNTHQNPSSGADYAARDTTSSHMTTAFGDGTKMQVEQAVVANATGMPPSIRGMHGIETTQENVVRDCAAALPDGKYIDYTLGGDFGAGVAVIARHENVTLHKKALSLYKMGDGPDYFFFRPYHLVHLELPATLAQVLLDQTPLASVTEPHVAEVVAMAKTDLQDGQSLDCIGGYTAYGLIDTYERASGFLPIGLVEFATMTCDVAVDQAIPLASVALDHSKVVVKEWEKLRIEWGDRVKKATRQLDKSFISARTPELHPA